MERFKRVDESISAHCCFGYSVVDTKDGFEDFGKSEDHYWKTTVCECFEKEHADMIVKALNKLYEKEI